MPTSKERLNNLCQYLFRSATKVTYSEPLQEGDPNAPTWMSICYFEGVEYGRGKSNTKRNAENSAAAEVLQVLFAKYGYEDKF